MESPQPRPVQRTRREIRHPPRDRVTASFDVAFRGINTRLTVLVAPDDPVKLCHLRITNQQTRSRPDHGGLLGGMGAWPPPDPPPTRACSPASTALPAHSLPAIRHWWTSAPGLPSATSVDASSTARTAGMSSWAAMAPRLHPGGVRTPEEWSPQNGAGRDPCCAFAVVLEIAPGASADLQFVLGQAENEDSARQLVMKYRTQQADALLAQVQSRWNDLLGAVQIRTPDRALDLLFNRWLLYQTIACRLWGRAAFYQCGGAYGFRDQLQDGIGDDALRTCSGARAPAARRGPAVRRGRCAALVASPQWTRRSHALLGTIVSGCRMPCISTSRPRGIIPCWMKSFLSSRGRRCRRPRKTRTTCLPSRTPPPASMRHCARALDHQPCHRRP